MVQLGDIIEIGSSPEHTPRPTTYKLREKGKGKATPYRFEPASSVIELTDSESEGDELNTPSIICRVGSSHSNSHAGPGPSSLKLTPNLKSYPVSPTKSLGNISSPTQQNGVLAFVSGSGTEASPKQKLNGHNHNPPLFLPGDEEHGSPAPDTAHVEANAASTYAIEREPTIPIPEAEPQSHRPGPIPIENIDPTSTAVAQILEIIPNVEPAHLLQLIETHLPTYSVFHGNRDPDGDGAAAAGEREATAEEQVQGVVGQVLHLLFENPDYPKADLRAGGKRKVERVGDPDDEDNLEGKGKGKAKNFSKKPKIDYASIERPFPGSPNYFDLALYYLQISFPKIPKPYLRRQLQIHKSLYAPTHISVLAAEKSFDENKEQRRPYTIKSSRITLKKPQDDVALEEEKAWLDAELAGGGNAKEVDETLNDVNEDAVMDVADDGDDDGTGIECQCCFADYPFSKMVQCPEAHLFCSTCISTYASTQLGTHNSSLTCIHPSSCSLPFPTSELKRILPVKLFELYERLEQQKEIRQAGLVGLEECPFCEWKCVVEASTEEDKLFRCGNEEGGCGVISCRGCKKLDHLPKSCKEVEEDKQLDGRHAIEEAMTRALMRNCPKCQKAFIKEQGCNKMSCPNCHTLSCYICRKVINGYDHFNTQQPGRPSTSADAKKCILWDPVEERHAQEVKEAAEKAMEEYKRDHPDIDESALKVDLPEAPAQKAQGQAVVAPGVIPNMHIPMGYPVYNPIPNPIVGQAHAYPQVQLPLPPQPRHVPVPRRQAVAHQRQPQLPRPAPIARTRAAVAERQRQAQQKRQAAATSRAERARIIEQVRIAEQGRIAEEERQILDRIRGQRAAARREQQERALFALESALRKREREGGQR